MCGEACYACEKNSHDFLERVFSRGVTKRREEKREDKRKTRGKKRREEKRRFVTLSLLCALTWDMRSAQEHNVIG